MERFSRSDLLIGGGILVVAAGLMADWMMASRAPVVPANTPDSPTPPPPRRQVSIAANEAAVLEDLRQVIAGQAAYRAANRGFYDGRLDCLASPQQCIPSYPPSAPPFLDSRLASLQAGSGYIRSFEAGPGPPLIPAEASATSATTYRYDAWPAIVGHGGVRAFAAFAADGTARICFTSAGTKMGEVPALDTSCTSVEPSGPKVP